MSSYFSRRKFLAAAASSAGAYLGGCPPWAGASERRTVRVLFTGDSHGHMKPLYHREPEGTDFLRKSGIEPGSEMAYLTSHTEFVRQAKKFGKAGGIAHVAALIRKERARAPERTLVLEAGDAWYGSAIAMFTDGRAPLEAMNAIGYDAMTLHWEFNLGRETLMKRIKEAKFPVLAQNLVDNDFEDVVLKPFTVKNVGGVRVGILGQAYPFSTLTTEDPAFTRGWRMGYRFRALRKHVRFMRKKMKVDLVILLSHMGLPQDIAFAKNNPEFDVIIGGHSHDNMVRPLRVGRTVIVHAGSHNKFVGDLTMTVGQKGLERADYRVLPVLAERIEADPAVSAIVAKHYAPYEKSLNEVVGSTETLLYRHDTWKSTTDQFISDAYRKIADADMGHCPGWRFGSSILPGEIRREDVYDAMKGTPSNLFVPKLRGKRIVSLFEDILDNVLNPDPLLRLGGDLFRFSGMRVRFRRKGPKGRRVIAVEKDGKPLVPGRYYSIATSGGRIQRIPFRMGDTGRVAAEELIGFIKENSPIRVGLTDNVEEVKA
ncbi:MAG: bifunctional metallophosphatase/5'-nucleotidase [Nitrospinota bacterium]